MRFATKFLAAPDRYILDTTVLAEEENKDKKQYTVAVRVALNVANLRNAVKSNSAVVAGTGSAVATGVHVCVPPGGQYPQL
jgi:hypothetical protein